VERSLFRERRRAASAVKHKFRTLISRAARSGSFSYSIPKGHTGPAEEMFEAVNAGWMDLGVEGTEHVEGTTSARDVFAAAPKAVTA
jgi:hypothetical protein